MVPAKSKVLIRLWKCTSLATDLADSAVCPRVSGDWICFMCSLWAYNERSLMVTQYMHQKKKKNDPVNLCNWGSYESPVSKFAWLSPNESTNGSKKNFLIESHKLIECKVRQQWVIPLSKITMCSNCLEIQKLEICPRMLINMMQTNHKRQPNIMHRQKGYNVNKKILRMLISESDLTT